MRQDFIFVLTKNKTVITILLMIIISYTVLFRVRLRNVLQINHLNIIFQYSNTSSIFLMIASFTFSSRAYRFNLKWNAHVTCEVLHILFSYHFSSHFDFYSYGSFILFYLDFERMYRNYMLFNKFIHFFFIPFIVIIIKHSKTPIYL